MLGIALVGLVVNLACAGLLHGAAESSLNVRAAYLEVLLTRNEGNITRSANEAGLTRYHLRELLKRHGVKGGDQE